MTSVRYAALLVKTTFFCRLVLQKASRSQLAVGSLQHGCKYCHIATPLAVEMGLPLSFSTSLSLPPSLSLHPPSLPFSFFPVFPSFFVSCVFFSLSLSLALSLCMSLCVSRSLSRWCSQNSQSRSRISSLPFLEASTCFGRGRSSCRNSQRCLPWMRSRSPLEFLTRGLGFSGFGGLGLWSVEFRDWALRDGEDTAVGFR